MPSPPPGVTDRDFQTALRELEGIVGRDWVFSSDEDVQLYRDGYSPLWGEPEERADGARGLATRAELEHLAEEDERGDDRRRLEVDRGHPAVAAE